MAHPHASWKRCDMATASAARCAAAAVCCVEKKCYVTHSLFVLRDATRCRGGCSAQGGVVRTLRHAPQSCVRQRATRSPWRNAQPCFSRACRFSSATSRLPNAPAGTSRREGFTLLQAICAAAIGARQRHSAAHAPVLSGGKRRKSRSARHQHINKSASVRSRRLVRRCDFNATSQRPPCVALWVLHRLWPCCDLMGVTLLCGTRDLHRQHDGGGRTFAPRVCVACQPDTC